MKMNIFSTAVAIAIAMTACKKNSSGEQDVGSNPATLKAKAWFEKERGKSPAAMSRTPEALDFTGDNPQWDKADHFEDSRTFVIPVRPGNRTRTATNKIEKFLVVQESVTGDIQNGYYVCLLSKEDQPETKPVILAKNDVPDGFNGAELRYSIDGTLLSSRHHKNGKLSPEQDKLVTKQGNGEPGSQNIVPLDEGCESVTIDWYWQTYVNGVLVNEVYLYSTTQIVCPGGGGGGSGNTPGDPCSLTCEQVDQVIENMSIATLHEVTGHGGAEYTDANGVIRKPWADEWKFLKLTLFPGYTPEYKAYFTGVLFRNSPAATKWKFESFMYNNWAHTAGSIPPCMDVDLTISVATAIAGDKFTANALLNGMAQAKVPCLNGYKAGKHPITNLPQTFAPPPVLLGED